MIQLNDFKRQWLDTGEDAIAALAAVGQSGWYILGEETREFESALARHWPSAHAIGVASGLDAIEISLKVLGCKPGDRVLTTPLSAFATTLAIVKLGAIPVFVDTDDFGLLDLAACRKLLESRRDIKFLVPVHLYGHALNLHELRALRDDFKLAIVEDCAQSISASFEGVPTGSVGQVAATSFYPTKNLGAIGDGGAILTANPHYAECARAYRDYGQSAKYRHDRIGYNSRLDELQAAILRRAFLPRLPQWTARRREIASLYLSGIDSPYFRPLGSPAGSEPVWHLFPVLVDPARKADFMRYLKGSGVASGEHYPIPIPDQEALADVTHEAIGSCSDAARIARSEVSLPIHPYLTGDEVTRVIAVCNEWDGEPT